VAGSIGQGPHASMGSRPSEKVQGSGMGPGPGSYNVGDTMKRKGGVTMAGRLPEKGAGGALKVTFGCHVRC
jgi:hypothetical protein